MTSITCDMLMGIAHKKAREASGATANRYLALVRAMLPKAAHEWEWIARVPKVRMFRETRRRVRWLTHEEAARLIHELPEHQAEMVRFALATGLRQAGCRAARVVTDRHAEARGVDSR